MVHWNDLSEQTKRIYNIASNPNNHTSFDEIKKLEDELRADEREKHFDKIMSFINTSNRGNCDYFIVDQIEEYIAEQLKLNK